MPADANAHKRKERESPLWDNRIKIRGADTIDPDTIITIIL